MPIYLMTATIPLAPTHHSDVADALGKIGINEDIMSFVAKAPPGFRTEHKGVVVNDSAHRAISLLEFPVNADEDPSALILKTIIDVIGTQPFDVVVTAREANPSLPIAGNLGTTQNQVKKNFAPG